MHYTKYLIIGSSHAGLSALDAIRMQDKEGSLTLVTQESCLPYSPTILPYVLSGQAKPEKVFLRDQQSLDMLSVVFKPGAKVVGVDGRTREVTLESGERIEYEKLLLATGAAPKLPPVQGLEALPHHVLRTLEDTLTLRSKIRKGGTALVMGAGLIGLHAAENLAKEGMKVVVVEALSQVLPGYFDEEASEMIHRAFSDNGVRILLKEGASRVKGSEGQITLDLASGEALSAGLLVVATGVAPRVECLKGSGVEVDQGILVDERMRTSVSGIWAAGDVAQARAFFGPAKILNGTLPNAVDQGRIAGMDMADDPALKEYPGAVGMNTYKFFGHRAFSAGMVREEAGCEVEKTAVPERFKYQKLIFRGDQLVGAMGVNSDLDPGIMVQLIRRKADFGELKATFCASPVDISRVMMTSMWR
ncbi:MAG: NADH-dependent phenylglyoxylate dehydrogenase subunit epsilon [Deltaproteobacteria bacterium]